jgi:hypothetical protein
VESVRRLQDRFHALCLLDYLCVVRDYVHLPPMEIIGPVAIIARPSKQSSKKK